MNKIEKQELAKEISQEVRKEMVELFGLFKEHVDEKFALVFEYLKDIDARLTNLEEIVAAHTEAIAMLMVEVEIIKGDIATLKKEVMGITFNMSKMFHDLKEKAAKSEVALLESRVSKIEKQLKSQR